MRCIILFTIISHFLFAQHSFIQKKQPALFEKSLVPVLLRTNIQQKILTLNAGPLRHEAFFCKMEDKVYSRLNIWIKLRAGNDEQYRKMIAIP